MADILSLDAYSPKEIAARVESVGVAKARQGLLATAMLGVLAGAFIGLGALHYALVMSDASPGFATARILGAVCFTLGLLVALVYWVVYLRPARNPDN